MTASARLALVLFWQLAAVGCADAVLPANLPDDRAAVESATQAYRTAWVTNDPEDVMATLTADAVIYPSTLSPISGADAIRAFWFSAPLTTRVTDMDLVIDSVHIDGDTALTSGTGSLTFVTLTADGASQPRRQRHWHVNVLRRQSDRSWKIWRRMWGDVR
jgi:uncharacterized protein (TIGR02246 family)